MGKFVDIHANVPEYVLVRLDNLYPRKYRSRAEAIRAAIENLIEELEEVQG